MLRIRIVLKKEFGTAFLQLGVIDEITHFENVSHRSGEFNDTIRQQRIDKQKYLFDTYGLEISFRENMPQSNIIYDVTKTDEELIAEMNSGCKERIKKAIKNNLNFRLARVDEYDVFYQKRCELGGRK